MNSDFALRFGKNQMFLVFYEVSLCRLFVAILRFGFHNEKEIDL